MKARHFLSPLILAFLACSNVDPQPGQEGGACRVSLEPCDPGLVCFGGGCNPPPEEEEAQVGVQWTFPPDNKMAVQADGQDALNVLAVLTDRTTGELMHQNFGFRMWVEPAEAGTLTILRDFNPLDAEGRWSLLDAEGRAVARFVGCNKDAPGCVRYASIRIAVEPRPLAAIDQVVVENLGAVVPGGGAGGAGGGAGGAGGGVGGAGGAGGGSEPLPPLGSCSPDRARVQVGDELLEMEVVTVQQRNVQPQNLNVIFANPELEAAVSVVIDTSGINEAISARTYPELGNGVRLEFNAAYQRNTVCAGFQPSRLVVEKYEYSDGLTGFSAQIGGLCFEQRKQVSACIHWIAP